MDAELLHTNGGDANHGCDGDKKDDPPKDVNNNGLSCKITTGFWSVSSLFIRILAAQTANLLRHQGVGLGSEHGCWLPADAVGIERATWIVGARRCAMRHRATICPPDRGAEHEAEA